MMKSLIYLFVISISFICCNQNKNQDNLVIGKWEGHKTIIIFDGDTLKVNNNKLQHIFFEDSLWWGFAKAKGYETFTYSLFDNHLTINGETKELLELSDSTLIYKSKGVIPEEFIIDFFLRKTGSEW